MRKTLVLTLGLALLAGLSAIAYAAPANDNTSAVKMKVTPSKLPKKLFKSVSLFTETSTLHDGDPGTPTAPTMALDQPTAKVKLDFDDDIKFNRDAVPACKLPGSANDQKTALEGTTTNAAISDCGKKSVVGKGTAAACANDGSGGCALVVTDVVVTAFNAHKNGTKPAILLHARSDSTNNTTVLVGTLTTSHAGSDFGKALTVPVDKVLNGAVGLTDFKVTVNKGRFVQARCHDGNKRLNVRATFWYYANVSVDNSLTAPDKVSASQKCRVA